MSCEESKDNVYICRYPLKVFCQKTEILYQMFYDLRWSDLSNMGDICKIGKKMADIRNSFFQYFKIEERGGYD